jgi:hypothetical protein
LTTARITGLIGAVVVLVASLAVFPTIIASIATAEADATAAGYTAVASVLQVLPLVVVAGLVGISGLLSYAAIKGRD